MACVAIGALLAAKFLTAVLLTSYAHRKDFVTARAIRNYVAIWLSVAALLVALVWPLIPLEMIPPDSGWNKAPFALLILFAVPVLRISYAPIALAQNRCR